jgi:hypothetical protein
MRALKDEGGLRSNAGDRGERVEAGLEVGIGGDDLSGARLEAGDFAVQGCEHGGERAGQRRVGVQRLAGAIGLGRPHGDELLAAGQHGREFALAFGRRAIGAKSTPARRRNGRERASMRSGQIADAQLRARVGASVVMAVAPTPVR